MAPTDVVVVTGFGPFSSFEENPSSQVVDELAKTKIPGFDGQLVVEKMSVAYSEVEEKVKSLWTRYSPKLVVHIGAHPIHHHIKLEQQSFGRGYCKYDVDGCVPQNNMCPTNSEPILSTKINCEEIASKVSQELGYKGLKITASDDPGRYLCAYSFYLSLSHDASRSLFIHVPPFDSTCTLEMVTAVVQKTITTILSTLDS
ncbi:pyroglutamyl-peptidase I [Dictyocaulus viviparus]|uniref:Pyroglutamyl-peptidase I n=1 Tax=Dictyocaulus viviparus TaxID=29172 RepID=A0A0D8Y9U2_DICVI|nr:pyroglutamyl-peptidase I [Dictyocaulus viviparus]